LLALSLNLPHKAASAAFRLFIKIDIVGNVETLYWPIDSELKKEAEEHYRTRFAVGLKDKEPLEIIRQITFDGAAPDIEVKDIEALFDFVERKFLKGKIKGIGVEVGSGPGTFSSVLAKRDLVEKIYAVEVCRPIVELLMPKVAGYVLGDKEDKLIGAVGSFDDMELPDESVDFVFDFFSLHHSDNLEKTLKECYRILKKGGLIFCFDKARPDYFTERDLDDLLDAEYGPEDKKMFGMPSEQKFTRRMNGEKEYRLKDWKQAFSKAGLGKIKDFYLAKPGKRTLKKLLSSLPVNLQIKLNGLLPEYKYNHKFFLSRGNKIYTGMINNFPKEISLMIAYKND